MARVETMKLQGEIDYAKVPARLKKFREDNPRSDIQSKPHWNEDGSLDFQSWIVRDLSDEHSMRGMGWAHYSVKDMQKAKAFEKLETISKGRALADMGYLNNGEIASTEEMEEFNEYKEERLAEARQEAIDKMEATKTLDDLRTVFSGLGELMADPEVVKVKDDMKKKLNEEKKDEEN